MNAEQIPQSRHIEQRSLSDVEIIMPIGGLATRAAAFTQDRYPKHLIPLSNGRTVIDTICGELQSVGFRKFTFCLGHHADQLMEHLDTEQWKTTSNTSHTFSIEQTPLGPDGAVLMAIATQALKGQGLIVPGDMLLPWPSVAAMSQRHADLDSDITLGVTSHTTEFTTDTGNIIGHTETGKLVWCTGRETTDRPTLTSSTKEFASAAATAISIERFPQLYTAYNDAHPEKPTTPPASLRDDLMPWVTSGPTDFDVRVYDLAGEILDLGTPDRIRFGQDNWQKYS